MTGENEAVEDLTDRTHPRRVVVTGASSGIGLAAAEEFARRGDEVVLVGRDPARLTAAGDRVRRAGGQRPALYRADFAALDDVRRLAEDLRRDHDRIDVLANNAGAIVLAPTVSVDGFELTVQANHLAPFLLTNLLRDRLGRVVTTASDAYRVGRLDVDHLGEPVRPYRPFRTYATSKLANLLFTAEAARRWPDLPCFSFHPGTVRTRFVRDNRILALGMRVAPFLLSPAKGADTLVWLAGQDPTTLVNGGYYVRRRPRPLRPPATDAALAERLWQASERAVGLR